MYHGWFQDSIWHLAKSRWRILEELPYALVTCIDSTEDVRSTTTANMIVDAESSCGFLGTSLLVGDGLILEIAPKYNLFSHFDEIWLYTNRPTATKPPATSIVFPTDLNVESPPTELLGWFVTSDCVLGLGDGIGMNYITTSSEIVEALNVRQQEV